jgi:signal transduction histidine kinase
MTLSRSEIDLEQSNCELHDLCQPLTAMQCRLEVGKMLGHTEALEEAINGSLEETSRMFKIIALMRERLLAIHAETQQSLHRQG